MHKIHLKSFVFGILFIGGYSSTFYLFLWQSLKFKMFLASKIEHFRKMTDILCQDIQCAVSLNTKDSSINGERIKF